MNHQNHFSFAIETIQTIFPKPIADKLSYVILYFSKDPSFVFHFPNAISVHNSKFSVFFSFEKNDNPNFKTKLVFDIGYDASAPTFISKISMFAKISNQNFNDLILFDKFVEFLEQTDQFYPNEPSVLIKACSYYLDRENLTDIQKDIIQKIYDYEIIKHKIL